MTLWLSDIGSILHPFGPIVTTLALVLMVGLPSLWTVDISHEVVAPR